MTELEILKSGDIINDEEYSFFSTISNEMTDGDHDKIVTREVTSLLEGFIQSLLDNTHLSYKSIRGAGMNFYKNDSDIVNNTTTVSVFVAVQPEVVDIKYTNDLGVNKYIGVKKYIKEIKFG